MAFGYRYELEKQKNGWFLLRVPAVPEALTEGETREEAIAQALDCVLAALEGYIKDGRPLPRDAGGPDGANRVVLPSIVTAKLAVYETMRARGWTQARLARKLAASENTVRRLLDLRHASHMWAIDAALAAMDAALAIDLPKPVRRSPAPPKARRRRAA